MRRIHWSECIGNVYLKKLDPRMLLTGGMVDLQKIRPPERFKSSKPEVMEVIYDRRFIEAKLFKVVLEPLGVSSLPELIDLLERSSKLAQND